MEDICNRLMENAIKAYDYCYDHCTEQHDIKHALSGALAGLKTYNLPDSKLKEWANGRVVESIPFTSIWLFCECNRDCACFSRCECKLKCTCGARKWKRNHCDVRRDKVKWRCTCRSEKVVKEGYCP